MLEQHEMKGSDISDDELAKSHARYMIGGRVDVPNERLFRFGESSGWVCAVKSVCIDWTGRCRVPGAARSAASLPRGYPRWLEHLVIPLPQPRRRYAQFFLTHITL